MKIIRKIFYITLALYAILCGSLNLFQEKIIFIPEKLSKNFKYSFENQFEEINIKAKDGKLLNGLLFKAENSKGLVFYLHGNGGSLETWGKVAKVYTDLNYDVYMIDYRSYGKSEGEITNEQQLFDDHQIAYNELKKKYSEKKIIVLGYSIGTGFAAQLASANQPKLLILLAPYYNLTDLMKDKFPIIPAFILRYKLATNEYLKRCKMPVVIFHGKKDQAIYYGSSLKLKAEFKPKDSLITLENQGHDGMSYSNDFKGEIAKILNKYQ